MLSILLSELFAGIVFRWASVWYWIYLSINNNFVGCVLDFWGWGSGWSVFEYFCKALIKS